MTEEQRLDEMQWWDFFKLFTYAFEEDPLSKRDRYKDLLGAGVSSPEIPDVRQDGSLWGGGKGVIRLRDSNDFIDLSSVTNRTNRYKEYERLRNVAEIEMAMTVFADEACVAGGTKVATPFYGLVPIKWLANNKQDEQFLVYCWDFKKNDYTLGWGFNPRKVKTAPTIRIKLNNGDSFIVTPDHRVLLRTGEWIMAGQLRREDELMPFYRVPADHYYNEDTRTYHKKITHKQFPRIFTFNEGWKHERQFVDEWRSAGTTTKKLAKVNEATRLIAQGMPIREVAKYMKHQWLSIEKWLHQEGFTQKEIRRLGRKSDRRVVIGISPEKETDVYDLSVEEHENFCGESVIFHNCQKGENGHVLKLEVENDEVRKELEFLLFHKGMLNIDRRMWNWAKKLFIFGDLFLELIVNPDSPKDGILKTQELPADGMYRIETTKGKTIEFQQSKDGPDYLSLTRAPITQATEADLQQTTAIRFAPSQIVHLKIGDDRRTFYPYGVSLIESARGPAHQLRLMEDAMVVYRLCLVGNSRIRTNNGWKYIKDIRKGDMVFTHQNDATTVPSEVIWWVNNGIQDVYKVKSQHIELTGTKTHPILLNRKGIIQYVDIQDINPKIDKFINITQDKEVCVEIPCIFEEKWAKLDWSQRTAFRNNVYENKAKLMKSCGKIDRIKQFLYSEEKALPYEQAVKICNAFDLSTDKLKIVNKGQINSERINLPKHVDEEFARLFGFLIGNGSIDYYRLQFSAGVDKKQNKYYANLLKKYFGVVNFEKEKRLRKTKGLGNYVLHSQFACKIFKHMGYIPGCKNKRIPNWVFTASKKIRRAFIEGLSDANGCERYTKKGTWFSTIELCNQQLVEDVKELWHGLGLCSGKLSSRKRNGGHEIEHGRKMPSTTCYSITISERKLPKYEKIWSVSHAGKEEVYDFTVNHKEHNFIVNGTCTMNTRAPERRVFYVDVGQLPPFKAEAFINRLKDQFRKKKVSTTRGGSVGAAAVEERWHAPAADEDYWLPIRPNANTRIETLPGAQNLGEIDDALYFRNKLFTALNFPKAYWSSEDPQATRITLSAQDVKFARMIERLQSHIEDGIIDICERHLQLRGFPENVYEDLKLKMTPPSDWRELSRAEIVTNRLNHASNLKSSMLLSDFDILTKWMNYTEEESQEMIARMKIQKLEDLKLQIIGQNPQLLGVGLPSNGEQSLGSEMGGPNPMLAPPGPQGPGAGALPGMGTPPMLGGGMVGMGAEQKDEEPEKKPNGKSLLPVPSDDDIKKYDLQIQNYDAEMDAEEPVG